jgi:thymidylate synthase ThyX
MTAEQRGEQLRNFEQERTLTFEPKVTPIGLTVPLKAELVGSLQNLRGFIQESEEASQRLDQLIDLVNGQFLTEEQIAATFARTSKSKKPFEELSREISAETASEFHRKWTQEAGHASIADLAIDRLRVDNFSSNAVDWVTDNRLGAYMEFSARYQGVPEGYYYTPKAIAADPRLSVVYREAQDGVVAAYEKLIAMGIEYLKSERAQKIDSTRCPGNRESEEAYEARLRRIAQDNFKNLMTSARLSNVGLVVDAREMKHIIGKFLASGNEEIEWLGRWLKQEGEKITPTLLRFIEPERYLIVSRDARQDIADRLGLTEPSEPLIIERKKQNRAELVAYDPDAENRFLTAFLYNAKGQKLLYGPLYERISAMTEDEREKTLETAFTDPGHRGVLIRDFEFTTNYLFEFLCDYGLLRELKRHRMNSYKFKELNIDHGYFIPSLALEMETNGMPGTIRIFEEAIMRTEGAYEIVEARYPECASYLVTRFHIRPALFLMNFRQLYYFHWRRIGPGVHYTAKRLVESAREQAAKVHPLLWKHLVVRTA